MQDFLLIVRKCISKNVNYYTLQIWLLQQQQDCLSIFHVSVKILLFVMLPR
ncbi:hypothetical protein IYQ_18536 [Aeromonas salmonicida subsp. salmonicida 01-B526]|uniref:Uncharacterized protein n=1 Tax=Aeromonas salmonicida subsp. salmonicida 01-B526 TaxID=1076135 RepID=A0ABN0DVV5_AERSS|nr:hypothetical protein IYQ_18536 [Aeromonas salmonicida subsp. salmonicida 01-B526]